MKETLKLEFKSTEANELRLVRWTLKTAAGRIEASPRDALRPFQWERKGVRALTLALVRLARWRGCGYLPEQVPLLAGTGRPTEATCLGDAALKISTVTWWACLLSVEHAPSAEASVAAAAERLRRWLVFENIQGRRADRPVTVSAVVAELPPAAITIFLDGVELNGAALDSLERRLSASLFGSLPPIPAGGALKMAGYMPSLVSDCTGREDWLHSLDEIYNVAENRVLVLLGGGGSGKTTLAREWLGRRCMADMLRQRVVFAWSFYRQGYGAAGGQVMAEFHTRLAEALGVQIADTMLPLEAAIVLLTAMRETPVLLFLDGLEVLQDAACPLHAGVRDPVLAELLLALGSDDDCRGCQVLITTRMALRESLPWSFPEVQHLKVRALEWGTHSKKPAREHSTLEWVLASGQTAGSVPEAAALLADIEQESQDVALPTLVRRVLESLAAHPEWALLLAISLFDRPPEWQALRTLLGSKPPLPRLTERWHSLTEDAWEAALDRLKGMRLLHLDAECHVVVHPRISECLADEMRRSLAEAWQEGQRRLCAYFADVPASYTPDTLLEMEPLFRAGWHGCQAADYRQVYETILFPRVSRGNSGYPIFELGAYEIGLALSGLISPDRNTYPPGCDLAPDDQVLLIHLAALCLRYLDRLEEAYECQNRAWQRIGPGCTLASFGPTGVHLLRCQLIFGDLPQTGPVMRTMVKELLRSPMSAQGLKTPASYLATAVGFIGVNLANVLWAKGHRFSARAVMRLAAARAAALDKRGRVLVPGIGREWHALLLLDMGEWQSVQRAVNAGELDHALLRNRQTGMVELIRGRVLSAQAAAAPPAEQLHLATEAIKHLQKGLDLVQRNRFRWWQCAFHLALTRHHLTLADKKAAQTSATACLLLAQVNGFKLMEIDAEMVLLQLNGGQAPSTELTAKIHTTGYRAALFTRN